MVLAVGVANVVLHVRRLFRGIGFRGARDLALLPVTPISQARVGRMKFRGVARGRGHVRSLVNDVPCVARRRITWSRGAAGNQMESERQWVSFDLDDGSGVPISIDPNEAVLDYETVTLPDAGAGVEEQYIRDGDDLVVVGEVAASPGAGYRDRPDGQIRFVRPPLVSWRSEPETLPRLRPPLVPTVLVLVGSAGTLVGFAAALAEGASLGPFASVTSFSLFFAAVLGFGRR